MSKVSCFYNCGASGLTLKNIEAHYQQYHSKFKAYYWPQDFTCDNCLNHFSRTFLYSPAQNQTQLNQNPHYCSSCISNQLKTPSQSPSKPKIMKKKIKSKLKPKKKILKKTTLALKPRQSRNPLDYYQCMKNCCLKKQKISQTAHECKTNALTINAQMSASKKKAVQKIRLGYRQMGAGLAEFIKANK